MARWAMQELLTVAEVAQRLPWKPSHEAARKWLKRSGLPLTRLGQRLLVDRRDLDKRIGAAA